MEMNDLNRGTNIDDDKSDERQVLIKKSPGTPSNIRSHASNIFGNFKPLGGDQVHPPDIHFSYVASFFIVAPTLYVMLFS